MELKKKVEKEVQDMGFKTMWSVTRVTVEHTLRTVCDQLLNDKEVSDVERQLRAEGLLIIGDVFRRYDEEVGIPALFTEMEAEAARMEEEAKKKGEASSTSGGSTSETPGK